MRKRFTYDEVKKYIEDKGCKLLSENFKNQKQKLKIKCSCGCEFERTFDNFKNKKQYICKHCSDMLKAEDLKKSYEEVKIIIEKENCVLLSMEYINIGSKLEIQCKCGNVFWKTLRDFQSGQTSCNECSLKRIKLKQKLSKQDVINILSEYNCELLGCYENTNTKMKIKCKCGEIFHKSLDNFKKYPYCKHCGYKEIGKKNSNPFLTDGDRQERRLDKEYKNAIKKAMERDNYTCQVCKKRGVKLNVHHILPFSIYKYCRYDIYNLITLCTDCHTDYHLYCGGFSKVSNVNLSSFEEWLSNKGV